MKTNNLRKLLLCGFIASASQLTADDSSMNFDISEVGLMKLLTVIKDDKIGAEPVIKEALTNADFRVFENSKTVSSTPSAEQLSALGKAVKADLVFYSETSVKEKNKFQDFVIFEGSTTLKIYSPTSKELVSSHTEKAKGIRHIDEDEAKNSARDRSIQAAMSDLIKDLKEKAHRLMVYEVAISGINNMTDLNYITAHMKSLPNVYQVRRKDYHIKNREALIEVIAHPSTIDNWRVHLEKMPRRKVKVTVKKNTEIRKKHPSWFKPASASDASAPSGIKKSQPSK